MLKNQLAPILLSTVVYQLQSRSRWCFRKRFADWSLSTSIMLCAVRLAWAASGGRRVVVSLTVTRLAPCQTPRTAFSLLASRKSPSLCFVFVRMFFVEIVRMVSPRSVIRGSRSLCEQINQLICAWRLSASCETSRESLAATRTSGVFPCPETPCLLSI